MSIYSDLLFLQGHITNVELAKELIEKKDAAARSNVLPAPSTSPMTQKRHDSVIDQAPRSCSVS